MGEQPSAPLVLAATEPLGGIYRELNRYPNLVEQTLSGNYDHLSDQQLHEKAWQLVRDLFAEQDQQAVAAYREARNGRAADDMDLVLPAAQAGRVETVLVAADRHRWGRFDEKQQQVEQHEQRAIGDEDLLDRAAIECWTHGATVHALPHEQMPEGTSVACVFRY